MSLIDFLRSDVMASKTIVLTGKDYKIHGVFEYADEDFIVLKGSDGIYRGMRVDLIDLFATENRSVLPSQSVSMDSFPSKTSKGTEDVKTFNEYGQSVIVSTTSPESSLSGQGNGEYTLGDVENSESLPSHSNAVASLKPNPYFKQFKPGDRIPLEELTHRDPKLVSSWKRKEKNQDFVNEFVNKVETVMQEISEANRPEDGYSMVAFGKIIELQQGFLFGFIDDLKDGQRYFFNKTDIVDPKLKDISGSDIQVVYYRGKNHKGLAAKSIVAVSTITDTLDLALDLLKEGELISARHIVTNVLEIYPENRSALEFKKAVMPIPKSVSYPSVTASADNFESPELFKFYKEGKSLMATKDYRGAIQSFQTALDSGFREEACIKEICMAYISLHSKLDTNEEKKKVATEGLSFISEYRHRLPEGLSTLFMLENFYFALGDYEEHIELVEDIISICGQRNDIPQYTFYLNKAAQSYIRLGELDKAMDAVMDGLDADPTHPQLQRTQFVLMDEMTKSPLNTKTEEME